MSASYVLFGLCIFACLAIAVIGMVGTKDNGADLMKGRRERFDVRKKASGTVTALDRRNAALAEEPNTRAA